MSTTNCGDLNASLACTGEPNEAILTPENTGSSDAAVILDIPQGAQIVDASGNVLYEQDGGPDKCKIKIPGA